MHCAVRIRSQLLMSHRVLVYNGLQRGCACNCVIACERIDRSGSVSLLVTLQCSFGHCRLVSRALPLVLSYLESALEIMGL